MQIAILIVALVLAVLVLSRLLFPVARESRPGDDEGRERRTGFNAGSPFHAVSIQPADGHCAAVQTLQVERFLSEEAPSLPLEECGAEDCRCRYIHHTDRRGGARDRRLGPAVDEDSFEFWSQRDRRNSLGRRQADLQLA